MLPAAAAHVFVADLDRPAFDAGEHHHLARVLRLRPGQAVTASDGSGSWRCCRFTGGPELEPDGPVAHQPRPDPPITIGFAPVKGDRPEWTVQKLTEVGVDRIIPFVARRSIVQWDRERAAHQVARWRRVVHQAAMQSRRTWLPVLDELGELGDVLERLAVPAATGRGSSSVSGRGGSSAPGRGGPPPPGAAGLSPVAFAQPGGDPPTLARPVVLVGPEGGWAPEELAPDVATVGLGPTVLRAETAAVAAGVLLAALRFGLVQRPI